LAADLGMSLPLSIHANSGAAIGICRRSGIGRVRHLAVGQLWVQDHLRRGTFRLYKVRGDEHPADLCTKYLARAVVKPAASSGRQVVRLVLRSSTWKPSICPRRGTRANCRRSHRRECQDHRGPFPHAPGSPRAPPLATRPPRTTLYTLSGPPFALCIAMTLLPHCYLIYPFRS
jgi:hypothetical protein